MSSLKLTCPLSGIVSVLFIPECRDEIWGKTHIWTLQLYTVHQLVTSLQCISGLVVIFGVFKLHWIIVDRVMSSIGLWPTHHLGVLLPEVTLPCEGRVPEDVCYYTSNLIWLFSDWETEDMLRRLLVNHKTATPKPYPVLSSNLL